VGEGRASGVHPVLSRTLYAVTRSNTRKDHKQYLRRHFHRQLKELWQQEPLTALRDHLDSKSEVGTIIRSVGAFQFAPLVCRFLTLVAEVRITLLRPEPPGRVITQSGDLDNRLKTLLDALKMPDQLDALPNHAAPAEDEAPFFCLLEDDNLITRIDVGSDRLLDPLAQTSEVVLLIHVRTKPTVVTFANAAVL
jgi:hypothetical protein